MVLVETGRSNPHFLIQCIDSGRAVAKLLPFPDDDEDCPPSARAIPETIRPDSTIGQEPVGVTRRKICNSEGLAPYGDGCRVIATREWGVHEEDPDHHRWHHLGGTISCWGNRGLLLRSAR